MKTFLSQKAWPVIAGLLASFVIMTLFEFGNSFIYPLPTDLDMTDANAVRAFTASLPWTAYLLVLAGWIAGAFAAGYITTWLSKETTYRLSLIVGVILVLLGVLNNFLIGHDLFFSIVGLPMFLIFTYLGHRIRRNKAEKAVLV